MDQCPVPITPAVLHQLNIHLHTYRKFFTGKQFVDGLVQLGHIDGGNLGNLVQSTAREHIPTVSYSVTSAVQLGQYLVNEGILICLLNYETDQSTPLESSSHERMNAVNTTRHSILEQAQPTPSPTEIRAESNHSFTSLSPTPPPPQPLQFNSRSNCWYKFSDLEDSHEGAYFHGAQILSICSRPPPRIPTEHNALHHSEFEQARFGTVYLLLDVFQQRSRKDPVAKHFLQRPNVILTEQQRTGNDISCRKIFRI